MSIPCVEAGDGYWMRFGKAIMRGMKYLKSIKPLAVGLLSMAALRAGDAMDQPYPFADQFRALHAAAPTRLAPDAATGLTRDVYLDLAERIVRMAAGWVDARGAVVDPVTGEEWAQTTPRFAASAAVLLHFGRVPELRDTAFRAMGYACARLARPETVRQSPDFWMRELATAYWALAPLAPPELSARWKADLARVQPEKNYRSVEADDARLAQLHNWSVYAAGGELMRAALDLGGGDFRWGRAFFDRYMRAQRARAEPEGLYRDPGSPINYDITTRLQVANALYWAAGRPAAAPEPELAAFWDAWVRRGGLTTLLYISPEGFLPYGGRSAGFQFQEALVAAVCELEASRHRAEGDAALAGRFKRAARLAARAIGPWIGDEPVRHIKNRFPPAAMHGCDTYGKYSVYALFCASVLGQAAIFADDTIAEAPTLAETGGYVAVFGPVFHKVFAAAAGHYAEIDTAADLDHDAAGLGRILLKGVPYGLLPAMPLAAKPKYTLAPGTSAPPVPLAVGPAWGDGPSQTLAGWTEAPGAVTVDRESPDEVVWRVAWPHPDGTVTLHGRLTAEGLSVTFERADGKPFDFLVPVLVHDGADDAAWTLDGTVARGAYGGSGAVVRFERPPVWREGTWANRNGLYRVLAAAAPEGRATVLFSPLPSWPAPESGDAVSVE